MGKVSRRIVLWLAGCACLCIVLEAIPVFYQDLAWILGWAVLVIGACAALFRDSDSAHEFWWLAAMGVVDLACLRLHPLMRLEATLGISPLTLGAYSEVDVYRRSSLLRELGDDGFLGLLALLALLAVIAALLVLCLRATCDAIDLAGFGPGGHERVRKLALEDESALADKAIDQLSYSRDQDVLHELARKREGDRRVEVLLKLPYPEDEAFLRQMLADCPTYRSYDLSYGWPHMHEMREVSSREESPGTKVTECVCACGLRRTTRECTEQVPCPHCGGTLFYNPDAFQYGREQPPKPWYGYDVYCDPDYYGNLQCSDCGAIMDWDFSAERTTRTTTYA